MAKLSETRRSATRTLDTVLVVGGVIAAALVGLWAVHAIVGLVLWVFKIAIIVVVVAVVVRLLTRSRS